MLKRGSSHCALGPADAVASSSSSDEEPSTGQPKRSLRRERTSDPACFHAAVLDASTEHMTVAQEWTQVVHSTEVLASISRTIVNVQASDLDADAKTKVQQEQEALGDAAVALSKLAHSDVRAALREWEQHEETTQESLRILDTEQIVCRSCMFLFPLVLDTSVPLAVRPCRILSLPRWSVYFVGAGIYTHSYTYRPGGLFLHFCFRSNVVNHCVSGLCKFRSVRIGVCC